VIEGVARVDHGRLVSIVLVDRAGRAYVHHDLGGLGEVERIGTQGEQVAGAAVGGESIVIESPPGAVA
jgi:hypothetical protein